MFLLTAVNFFIFLCRKFCEGDKKSDDEQQNTCSTRHHDEFWSTFRTLHRAVTHFYYQFIYGLANWFVLNQWLPVAAHLWFFYPSFVLAAIRVCLCFWLLLNENDVKLSFLGNFVVVELWFLIFNFMNLNCFGFFFDRSLFILFKFDCFVICSRFIGLLRASIETW